MTVLTKIALLFSTVHPFGEKTLLCRRRRRYKTKEQFKSPHRISHSIYYLAAILFTATLLTGCAVQEVHRGSVLDTDARWAILPFSNYSETPRSEKRTEAIISTLLRTKGIVTLQHYKALNDAEGMPELNEQKLFDDALAWARRQGYAYAITGSVEEWRYKSGLDGEPAVGITVRVIDLDTNDVLWSASGARTGLGRESLSGTAQKLLKKLLSELDLN